MAKTPDDLNFFPNSVQLYLMKHLFLICCMYYYSRPYFVLKDVSFIVPVVLYVISVYRFSAVYSCIRKEEF